MPATMDMTKNLGFIIRTTKTRRRIRFYLLILGVWCALLDILLKIQKKEEEEGEEEEDEEDEEDNWGEESVSSFSSSDRPMYFAE